MINLEELEKMLDEALNNETKESLTEWILNQRNNSIENFFGSGVLKTYKEQPYSFNCNTETPVSYTPSNNNDPCEKLAFAA